MQQRLGLMLPVVQDQVQAGGTQQVGQLQQVPQQGQAGPVGILREGWWV